jgi:argininosuccinate synthase
MKIALAYSGGLDTSVAARWLAERHHAEVLAVTVDVGQHIDHEQLRARAAAAGAALVVIDAREEFVRELCWPALQANALYEGKYPLVSSLARPLIAAKVIEAARAHGADAVAHGCTGKGNDQVRFETSFAALAPELPALAPVREAAMSRDEARRRAAEWGIPLAAVASTYSVDENLWGRTVECGPLEDPWAEPPPDAFELTADPLLAPEQPEVVVVGFEAGLPVALDGEPLAGAELIGRIGAVGGRHGFGRVDMIENRLVGIKSRELYEVPAALALITAHRDLEDLTLERELAHEKAGVERRWAELAYNGLWHGPLHASLRAFVASTQAHVTGEVRLRFHKGSCSVVGRRSPVALYDHGLATYEAAADRFDHADAAGFVRLWSLPTRTWAAAQGAGAAQAADASVLAGATGARSAAAPAEAAATPSEPEGLPDEPVTSAERTPAAIPVAPFPEPGHVDAAGSGPLWAGRFGGALAPEALAFTRSLPFDRRLAPYDIRATGAHVQELARAGVLSDREAESLQAELGRMAAEIAAGGFPWSDADEDVHSAIERVLTERLGPVGAKVHAGRSRNDLVVTDLRLWALDAAADLAAKVGLLAEALGDRAATDGDAVMPGYTHVQRAQPILLAHHLLAHAFPLTRDAGRLLAAREAADVCALGAGALAGTNLAPATDTIARRLGFSRSFDNSIDAVADRDFALELLGACTIAAVHLSRLAEDVVLWTTEEFGFATLPDSHSTGSSMMPQKRNADVAELARAKVGRVLGDLVALATVMKGLPLAYDRDLQEDKEPLFDAYDTLAGALDALCGLVRGLRFRPERMLAAVSPSLFATDVADALVEAGVPFRQAHREVGRTVAELESEGRSLADLGPEEWERLLPPLRAAAAGLLVPERAVDRRSSPGGTSRASVQRQLTTLRSRLAELRGAIAAPAA